MDAFQQELLMAVNAAQQGKSFEPSQSDDPYFPESLKFSNDASQKKMPGQEPGPKPPGLEQFTDAQIQKMYQDIMEGKMPAELQQFEKKYTDENGNPIIDAEGGATIQPNAGFVIKTKNLATGEKVFVNILHHDIIEPIQEKAIAPDEAAKMGSQEVGLRIPLSLGSVKEERDKKGEPAQVFDFIFNTTTVQNAQKDANFRQGMVEVCFNYIQQKFEKQLDMNFTIPKMKYKGATISYQRVKAKKSARIQEVPMTPEERAELERRALEEERRKEAMREKEPAWKLFCVLDERLNKEFARDGYLQTVIKDAFENDATGDEKDRWAHLAEHFELHQQFDVLEEFDGLNQDEASGLVLTVTLPMLSRGHAIQAHVLHNEFVQVQVPNLYYSNIALPFKIQSGDKIKSYFDCKVRRLFMHFVRAEREETAPAAAEEEEPVEVFEEVKPAKAEKDEIVVQQEKQEEEEQIEEIDTDEVFNRGDTGKKQAPPAAQKKVATSFTKQVPASKKDKKKPEPPKEEPNPDDDEDLLYDLC